MQLRHTHTDGFTHRMQQRALVVVACAIERRQQKHGDISHGTLRARQT
jgi:hypothetical protein